MIKKKRDDKLSGLLPQPTPSLFLCEGFPDKGNFLRRGGESGLTGCKLSRGMVETFLIKPFTVIQKKEVDSTTLTAKDLNIPPLCRESMPHEGTRTEAWPDPNAARRSGGGNWPRPL